MRVPFCEDKIGKGVKGSTELVQAIEEKAGQPKYRAGRRSIYDELKRLLPEKEYAHVLSIIDGGYALLGDEPLPSRSKRRYGVSRNTSKGL